METEEWKSLCEKVKLQYGPEAEKIVRDRPGLTGQDITNFDIFDKRIIDLLGFGGVNAFITYSMSSSSVISQLVNDDELLNAYRKFAQITGDFYPNSAIGLNDRLNAFYSNRELILNIIYSGRMDELKDNLLLMLRDQEFKGLDQLIDRNNNTIPVVDVIKQGLKVSSIEELANYNSNRNNVLDNAINDSSLFPDQIREIIIMKYFGNIYDKSNSTGRYDGYDHEKFLNDYLKFNSCELSEDEIDLIEIYSMLQETEDKSELRRLNDFLGKRKENVNPVRMKGIDKKVVESYKKEYVDSLIKVKDVEAMVADSSNKAYLDTIYKKNGEELTREYRMKKDGTIVYRDHIKKPTGEVVYEYDVADSNYGIMKRTEYSQGKESLNFSYKGEQSKVVIKDGHVTEMHLVSNSVQDSSQKIEIIIEPLEEYSGDANTAYIYRLYSKDGTEYDEYKWDGNYKESPNGTSNKTYRKVNAISGDTIIQKKLTISEPLRQYYYDAFNRVSETGQTFVKYIQELKNILQ